MEPLMEIVELKAFTPFLRRISRLLEKKPDSVKQISIILTKGPNNLIDLFVLGRLLALVHELQNVLDITVEFVLPSRKNINNLEKLGFVDYCTNHNIKLDFTRQAGNPVELTKEMPLQLELLPPMEVVSRPRTDTKVYWNCLSPLREHTIQPAGGEKAVSSIVSQFLRERNEEIVLSLDNLGIDVKKVSIELSRIMFTIVKELVSNTIIHSGSDSFLFAMTLSREPDASFRPHRPGFSAVAGQDKFEVLVMDFGKGILPGVRGTLTPRGELEFTPGYHSLAEWTDSFKLERRSEEALLENILHGDLMIRKGRRSEGLFELSEAVAWFNGLINIHTGRTEIHIISQHGEGAHPRVRGLNKPSYLPGVIASAMLPSTQVQMITSVSMQSVPVGGSQQTLSNIDRACDVRRYPQISPAFFGGLSMHRDRRKSELDASVVINAYGNEVPDEAQAPVFFEIDLQLSENIDVGFVDSFIQELAKSIDEVETPETNNFFGIFFSNVPKQVIYELRSRSCHSFLMLKNTFCLLLDESDNPHFLGVPRLSGKSLEIEDVLRHLFVHGILTREEASHAEKWALPEGSLEHLQRLLRSNRNSLFYRTFVNGKILYVCRDIQLALKKRRHSSIDDLESVLVQETRPDKPDGVFQLKNGRYVNCIVDFCLYWSDHNNLMDAAKLLLEASSNVLADTIITFMNNGDRLASMIQRFIKTPNLVILDPHSEMQNERYEFDTASIIVVDALYPGDEEAGYVASFIESAKQKPRSSIPKAILAFADYRTTNNGSLLGVEVCSVDSLHSGRRPREVAITSGDVNIIRNFEQFLLAKPDLPTPKPNAPKFAGWPTFGAIELSSEFWQNVSTLEVISAFREGREVRSVLFYENNEKLLQSERLRRIVNDFVSHYVTQRLDGKVDVILHPTHPVGSFIAQLIASHLGSAPIIIPLAQRQYGGPIELTISDRIYAHEKISARKSKTGKEQLKCVIVDDSVYTGSSLFTMLGVAAQLHLEINGALVLLNRLSAEVSEAVSSLGFSFAYLYRLHMPLLQGEQSPDARLVHLTDLVQQQSNSYYAKKWGTYLKAQGSHFLSLLENVDLDNPPKGRYDRLQVTRPRSFASHELDHIINHLILHPDPKIINFPTRVAITYNFLEALVAEESFWGMLEELLDTNIGGSTNSQSLRYIREVIFIMAFSKYIRTYSVYRTYQHFCMKVISKCFESDEWERHYELLNDCMMVLGIIGSELLLGIGKTFLPKVIERSIHEVSKAGTADIGGQPATSIAASFAWSMRVLFEQKRQSLLDSASSLTITLLTPIDDDESTVGITLIDIMEPVTSRVVALKESLGIVDWDSEDDYLRSLTANKGKNVLMRYLKEAPGYSCTLFSILRICKADTVLLYSKSATDARFSIRTYESRDQRASTKDFKNKDLTEEAYSQVAQARMKKELFFVSSTSEDAKALDRFAIGSNHLWCIGAPIGAPTIQGVTYYLVLGFKNRPPSPELQRTAYDYWLRCEAMLREILPEIESRYFQSSTTWNSQLHGLSPFHFADLNKEDHRVLRSRKRVIRHAMASIDVGDLLRRAVRMSDDSVHKVDDIQKSIKGISTELQRSIADALQHTVVESVETVFPSEVSEWPVRGPDAAFPNDVALTYCSLPMSVLEFITYECLCNALSYYDQAGGPIRINLRFASTQEKGEIAITFENKIYPDLINVVRKQRGILACETAAAAVDGVFHSSASSSGKEWVASVQIPVFVVPKQLREELNDYLR
jgi:adenine/guanine phosphoribosyltransferase-like PRPP-binding protein